MNQYPQGNLEIPLELRSHHVPMIFVISAAFFSPAGTAFGHGIPGRWKLGRRAWHAARPM